MTITGAELKAITDDELREIYRKIASNERPRGSFLTAFAQAVVRADHENIIFLKPSMIALATKYDLWDYRFDEDAIKKFPPEQ